MVRQGEHLHAALGEQGHQFARRQSAIRSGAVQMQIDGGGELQGTGLIHERRAQPDEFHTATGDDDEAVEFIELQNNTEAPVALYDASFPTNHWKLGGGVEFAFPASVSLAAGACLLVVDFDPTDATALAAMLGAAFILDDPIFNGLAVSLIFGIAVSTLLTLVVIPVFYYALYQKRHAAPGAPVTPTTPIPQGD